MSIDEMITKLEERMARDRDRGGDMFFYGNDDPLDVAILFTLKAIRDNG